jgi:uncharacterized membrane protein YhaH (DUF805 family)
MLEAYLFLSGRLRRLAYFGYSILLGLILLLIMLIMLLPARGSPSYPTVAFLTFVVVGAIGLWASIALSVKRLHDLNLSGWHYAWMWLLPNVLSFLGNQQYGLGLMPLHSDALQGAQAAALAHISILQIVAGVVGLVIWLFLQFWPGTDGSYVYGYQP